MKARIRLSLVLVAAFGVLFDCVPSVSALPDTDTALELLDESHGPIPSVACISPNCGIVVSISHHLGVEPVSSEDGSGVYFSEEKAVDLYPTPPLAAPMGDDQTTLVKETQLWDIQVQMLDGTIQTVQQDFEPLFGIGAQVVVDGDKVTLWE